MCQKTKKIYEQIRNIPVATLLGLGNKKLTEMEHRISIEVHVISMNKKQIDEEYRRAKLALKWLQGILRIKKNGGI